MEHNDVELAHAELSALSCKGLQKRLLATNPLGGYQITEANKAAETVTLMRYLYGPEVVTSWQRVNAQMYGKELQAAKEGDYIVLTHDDEGLRVYVGQVEAVKLATKGDAAKGIASKPPRVIVNVYPASGGDAKQRLILHEAASRQIRDLRSERLYEIQRPVGKELASCVRVFDMRSREVVAAARQDNAVALPPKEIAIAIMTVMSGKPRTARRLARKSKIKYTDMVLVVLGKLEAANKIQKIEGKEDKWRAK